MTDPSFASASAARRGTVAFVTANPFEFDSRHRRATSALAADGWSVVVVAMRAPHLPEVEVLPDGVTVRRPPVDRQILAPVPARLRRLVGRLLAIPPDAERLPSTGAGFAARIGSMFGRLLEIVAYRRRIGPWTDAAVAAAPDARLWVCKALVTLPVIEGAARRTGGRYVYDIADLHVESGRLAGMPGPLKRLFARREAALVRRAAALIAVTPAMADEIAARHAVPLPTVVMNTREPWRPAEGMVRSGRLHEAAGLPEGREVVLYQGAFRRDQGIELLLAALDQPPLAGRPVTVVFLGFGVLENRLRGEAAMRPGRIAILPAVPSAELLDWTAGADVAFIGTPPVTRNQRLTTPNKLFESIMAGVPVVVADGTWTARLVEREGLGAVIRPWTAAGLAAGIAALLDRPAEEREAERVAIRRAALERLSWEQDRARLVELFRRLA